MSVQDQAKSYAYKGLAVGKQAALSGTYLYPLRGIVYLASSPSLYKPLLQTLAPRLAIAFTTAVFLFLFTYLPQATILTLFSGPLGFASAIPLVLSEAGFLTNVIVRIVGVGEGAIDEVFDKVLIAEGMGNLVQSSSAAQSSKRRFLPKVSLSKEGLVRYLISLPLNLLPILGTPLFFLLNGTKLAESLHARYFSYKSLSGEQQHEFVKERYGEYTAFGVVGVALGMVPVVGTLAAWTNAVGAALWARDLERKGASAKKAE
ncbi:hypothetical protein SAICODRAFT_73736 [Saitoella complicata NRRL Y-17804]|uniref:Uncharacterized protein n=1 Tax=Saitoella complicata (strain BCRC 22490 / CBS 7301 / JCM 7358 / NBRC 10748 / NRRL Y-17804) TaxID=698492 RepID=A0A0E9NIH5_SAICN|nr:uncharacterized protein SAICODRAFT_73736 [Saitoella complicata NRRL Y-17804]ODQ49984.1 hypothetical protein SAICODRAFT_73736 [Saitoella complicata NRRL Y-17804]GAO49672.1 hypothetical protein G7K_3819-t1 [Saitoella complicata NRRL Y-17804]